MRRVGMAVPSKPTGAGGAERNWADVKVVSDKKKAAALPEWVEKQTLINGMSSLFGKDVVRLLPWPGEVGLRQDAALHLYATSRRFYNYTEDAHTDVVNNQKVENGAKLAATVSTRALASSTRTL